MVDKIKALNDIPVPNSVGRMGRPPLRVKSTHVRLPEGFDKRIDEVAGPNRRAQFIRDAVKEKLEKIEAEKPKGKR